jgi:lysophospholipase L1-like esterase
MIVTRLSDLPHNRTHHEAWLHDRRCFAYHRPGLPGGKPVIVSSVTRRTFDATGKIDDKVVRSEKSNLKGTLTDYARTAQAVAEEKKLPFIDLHRLSIAHHNQIGREASMTYNWKEGDTTHFNRKGAEAITDLIVPELKKIIPELATCLK